MVRDREGFQKTYDLSERVLPAEVDTRMPTMEEFAAHILKREVHCHGFVSLKGLTYLRRDAALRKAIKTLVEERLAQGELEQLRVSSGEVFFIQTGGMERPLPRLGNRMLILSPFDNSVIQRQRLETLFQFDYQIECYVPAAKRRYGYFCLPLLYRDEFIGRMDCKAHRKTGCLEILSLHFEKHNFDKDAVTAAFVDALTQFCQFQGCESVSFNKACPKHLARYFTQKE